MMTAAAELPAVAPMVLGFFVDVLECPEGDGCRSSWLTEGIPRRGL